MDKGRLNVCLACVHNSVIATTTSFCCYDVAAAATTSAAAECSTENAKSMRTAESASSKVQEFVGVEFNAPLDTI